MAELLTGGARLPAHAALTAWSCRRPALAPGDDAVVYVGDEDGSPRVWITPLAGGAPAHPVDTGPQPVADVSWSPTGERLAVLVAPGGGEHTQVWTVRPDGGDLRPLAAPPGGSASFVRWTHRGDVLLLAETSAEGRTEAVLADAATGARQVVAAGPLLWPAAASRDHAAVLLRRGPRGRRRMSLAALPSGHPPGEERELLPGLPGTTDHGALPPLGDVAYLLSDAGRDRAALVAVPAGGEAAVLAERPDAELDRFSLSPDGRRAVLVWNVDGRSELAVVETETGRARALPPPPADVVTSVRTSLDGSLAVLAAESPTEPSHVLVCDLDGGGCARVAGAGPLPGAAGAEPVRIRARDGLELAAWLYRPPGARGPAPFAVHLHGGPEDQERPAFNPLYQNLLAAGIGVLAPNVRGSAGYGRAFREADDLALRFRAIDDVADCVAALVRTGAADPGRIACMGWSYGGYLTLAALTAHPGMFRAGVDVCGIADFETFYARTEPWIAAAAVSEYGHPEADRDLLRALSPLRAFDRITAPLLVVHGARDTNVPLHEAQQVIAAAAARGLPCDHLIFPDEGHEIRRTSNRVSYVGTVVSWLSRHLLPPP
ncbi:prolyl oligopeptidase family serine peptidase [Nonomuraea pusilla]|uniref:Dipeptidyl aminopeptidase/acylaminoacyl peptidase n=1 Tax=Nonomuraea pusilla TaxID=46177 RepID=A0A1H7WRS1_9ACTN|nr:prolyl oligopeptidase family serine peptidase [Nonomuraea pusilla]SEM24240.1 Dipeptidyl aminopeptidase/acylaminoacyl peptidase [Nonomuraea pusilla]